MQLIFFKVNTGFYGLPLWLSGEESTCNAGDVETWLSCWTTTNIPLCVYTTWCSDIYLLVDIWIASISWLLWIMPQPPNSFLHPLHHCTFPPAGFQGCNLSTSLSMLTIFVLLNNNYSNSIKWYLIVTSDVEHLFHVLIGCSYIFWRNVCSHPLPSFELVCFPCCF